MRFFVALLLSVALIGCNSQKEPQRTSSQAVVRKPQMRKNDFTLTNEEKQLLLSLARKAIEHALKLTNDKPTWFRTNIAEGMKTITQVVEEVTKGVKPTENLKRKCGLFVTLRTPGMDPDFCGCIGIFKPELPLYKQVPERALYAAFYDNRFWGFRDVTTDLLKKHIKIEVSVLTPPKPAKIEDVVLGKHGVLIEFKGKSATYLPIVGEELKKRGEIRTGKDFVIHCVVHKAGLPRSVLNDPEFHLKVYTALRFEED